MLRILCSIGWTLLPWNQQSTQQRQPISIKITAEYYWMGESIQYLPCHAMPAHFCSANACDWYETIPSPIVIHIQTRRAKTNRLKNPFFFHRVLVLCLHECVYEFSPYSWYYFAFISLLSPKFLFAKYNVVRCLHFCVNMWTHSFNSIQCNKCQLHQSFSWFISIIISVWYLVRSVCARAHSISFKWYNIDGNVWVSAFCL